MADNNKPKKKSSSKTKKTPTKKRKYELAFAKRVLKRTHRRINKYNKEHEYEFDELVNLVKHICSYVDFFIRSWGEGTYEET